MKFLLIALAALLAWLTFGKFGRSSASGPGAQPANSAASAVDYTSNMEDLTDAWARNEGFYASGTVPYRYNNPGDLKVQGWTGQVGSSPGGFAIFQDVGDGWDALVAYIKRMATKHPDWDFYDLSAHALGSPGEYPLPVNNQEGDSNGYAERLADYVGVDPATPVATYLGLG